MEALLLRGEIMIGSFEGRISGIGSSKFFTNECVGLSITEGLSSKDARPESCKVFALSSEERGFLKAF